MPFRLNNKWPGGPVRFDFTKLPSEFDSAEGMMPVPLTLDDRIGTETVLILFDPTDFIHQLAAARPFDLMMKSGMVDTDYGPLMFILFWIPNTEDPNEPLTAVECHVNPLDPQHMSTWRDLARQSHWHLFLLDADNQQQGFFEFENVYGLGETLDRVAEASQGMESVDFMLAKQEFCNLYDVSTLLKM
jgi:hypothetical protein